MKSVYITGTGITKFGELWNRDLRSLAIEAALQALNSANIKLKQIDAIFVANMNADQFNGQNHLGALIASELGVDVPAYHLESACASGSLAINSAYLSLLSGAYQTVLVIGVEKMTDVSVAESSKGLSGAADEEWESFFGVTFPSLYAMIAREHMQKYGTTSQDLAMVSVKNHANASLNNYAQFQNKITVEQVLTAPKVAEPLGLFDCSPVSDGAAAIVMTTKDRSNKVQLLTSQMATSSIALHDRADITTIDATVKAAKLAYDKLKISAQKIDIAEVHDCFSIAEILAYEDLGFAKKGEGNLLIRNAVTTLTGKLPVNTSGGLKGCGHPVGATGVKQAIEIVTQLSGQAGKRQVNKNNLHLGLTHNVGGSGASCIVNIFAN